MITGLALTAVPMFPEAVEHAVMPNCVRMCPQLRDRHDRDYDAARTS